MDSKQRNKEQEYLLNYTKSTYNELEAIAKNTASSDFLLGFMSGKNLLICLYKSFNEFVNHFGLKRNNKETYKLARHIFASSYLNRVKELKYEVN